MYCRSSHKSEASYFSYNFYFKVVKSLPALIFSADYMSLDVRKPDFCICENKDAVQLRGNREADQRLCFCYLDSTIPLLPKYEISSLWSYSVTVQPGLCQTWSETPKTGFLRTRLIFYFSSFEIKECILRIRKVTCLDSFSNQIFNMRVIFRLISVFGMTALLNLPIYSIFLRILLPDLIGSLMRLL